MDHESYTENFKTEHGQCEVFESTGNTDYNSQDDGPEARSDTVDVRYVAGVGDRKTVDGLEEVVEVGIPEASVVC